MTRFDHDIIRSPVISEKTTLLGENNQVVFQVSVWATKLAIRRAVERLFKVKVAAVNTVRQQGKVKVRRGHLGRRPATKKAIVTLAQGETLDLSAGI